MIKNITDNTKQRDRPEGRSFFVSTYKAFKGCSRAFALVASRKALVIT